MFTHALTLKLLPNWDGRSRAPLSTSCFPRLGQSSVSSARQMACAFAGIKAFTPKTCGSLDFARDARR